MGRPPNSWQDSSSLQDTTPESCGADEPCALAGQVYTCEAEVSSRLTLYTSCLTYFSLEHPNSAIACIFCECPLMTPRSKSCMSNEKRKERNPRVDLLCQDEALSLAIGMYMSVRLYYSVKRSSREYWQVYSVNARFIAPRHIISTN